MAEASCTSLASKSIANPSLFIPHYLPSKPFLPLPSPLSFHHSNVAQRSSPRRTRNKQLRLACLCSPSSSDFDLVSTHEHSDGSLVFRFGDPSEVVKNDQSSEPNPDNEETEDYDNEDLHVAKVLDGDHKREVIVRTLDNKELEGEDNYNFNVVNVLDGDHKREVIVKKIDRKVKGKISVGTVKESDSVVVISGNNIAFKQENSSSETSTSGPVKVEKPVSFSSVERNDLSAATVEVKDVVNVEESIETNHSSGSGSEVVDVVNVEECVEVNNSSRFHPIEDEIPVSVTGVEGNVLSGSIVDNNNVLQVEESSEMNDSSESVVELENVVHTEESPMDKDDDNSSLLDSSRLDHDSGAEDRGVSSETLEPIIVSNSLEESVPAKLDSVDKGLGDDSNQQTSQNLEAVHSSTTVDALSLQPGVQEGTTRDNDETDIVEIMPLSPPSDAKPILDEEVGSITTEESVETDRIEDTIMLSNSSKSVLEVERTKEMVGGDELVNASTSKEKTASAKLFLASGATILLSSQKALTGGEDAYFICQNWLGVADGVGHWSLEGTTTPGVFAKELIENCQKIVAEYNDAPITAPEQVLNLAVAKTNSPGSSTALVAHFDGQAFRVTNIGDSRFIVLRNNAVFQRSSPMLHEFYFPVQIQRDDDPSNLIESYKIDLEEGDVVVVATDGLFDDLYEQEIKSVVLNSLEADKNSEEISEILATTALEMGSFTSTRTPFADVAQAAGYAGYTGGKPDNVAVIVSLVEKGSNSHAS